MNAKPIKSYDLIKTFTNGCLDKRTTSYKSLKATSTLCREAIERLLSENPDFKDFIHDNNEHDIWIKELIINYTLLKMHHHAVLWEIDDHELQFQKTPHGDCDSI